ncbi:hypothetical protein Pfo_008246 [Paulownia fortunei]|nr:hypothetical protein Pfo_008246 [Paulownia fortunei]
MIHRVSTAEMVILMEVTGNVMEMQLIPFQEIREELSRHKREVAAKFSWIHIGAIKVVVKATFKEGIDSPLNLAIFDKIAYNLVDRDFSRVLTLHQDFKNQDLMKEGNRPYSITYRVNYFLSNIHHSELFLRKEFIEVPRIFDEFAHAIPPRIMEIPYVGEVDMRIKDQPVLQRSISFRQEPRMLSIQENRRISFQGERMFSQRIGKRPIIDLEPEPILITAKMKYPEGWQEINVSKRGYIDEGKLRKPKMKDERKFGEALLQWRQEGEGGNHSEKVTGEVLNLMKVGLTTSPQLDNDAEGQLELEQVKRKIRRNYSENPLAWWDKNEIEAVLKIKEQHKYELVRYKPILMNMQDKEDMQTIIKEYLDLKLI